MAEIAKHYVMPSCGGVTCHMCKERPATHKVGEECETPGGFSWHELEDNPNPDPYRLAGMRHNLTAYVCCECFGKIMGQLAIGWCNPK